jgi:hypothetical protein
MEAFCSTDRFDTNNFVFRTSKREFNLTSLLFTNGPSFGSGISTTGAQFDSFVMQPGTYLINLAIPPDSVLPPQNFIQVYLNGEPVGPLPDLLPPTLEVPGVWLNLMLSGDHMVQVSAPNTVMKFNTFANIGHGLAGGCRVSIIQLQ